MEILDIRPPLVAHPEEILTPGVRPLATNQISFAKILQGRLIAGAKMATDQTQMDSALMSMSAWSQTLAAKMQIATICPDHLNASAMKVNVSLVDRL